MSTQFPGDPFAPRRRKTRVVRVGDIAIGGDHPVRVQSMTTTDTQDVKATADQAERLADTGCEIVRITAPSLRDAEALAEIRAELDRRGVNVPLVADIHFTPNAAMLAAEAVEKVRVNPGNFADKKKFEIREYDDAQYDEEIERVADRFRPLVLRCKELGRALRIGTNHGSLSDRIMNRFGDTPEGMVQSALEFLEVCQGEAFHDVIFSMKASNPKVAIQAYRLLAVRLAERDAETPGYPLHVGVTEAGGGEDGRVKSAIGIGSLLFDGLGDTIRVSLTEDPAQEVPVAQRLARAAEASWRREHSGTPPALHFLDDAIETQRRRSARVVSGPVALGADEEVRVELDLGSAPQDPDRAAWQLGDALAKVSDLACEGLRIHANDSEALDRARRFGEALSLQPIDAALVLVGPPTLIAQAKGSFGRVAIEVPADLRGLDAAAAFANASGAALEYQFESGISSDRLAETLDACLAASPSGTTPIFSLWGDDPIPTTRLLAAQLRERGVASPILLQSAAPIWEDEAMLGASTHLGTLLCDGIGDAVALPGGDAPDKSLELAYRILQGARLRTSWTEFISCPSCGRTLFDLEETTARIQAKTGHLKGVKIAVMGCIVNGPGEMADADFGYVGSGPGVVNLYVGHECVERRVPEDSADDRLVELIREYGRWVDPLQ